MKKYRRNQEQKPEEIFKRNWKVEKFQFLFKTTFETMKKGIQIRKLYIINKELQLCNLENA